MRLKATCLAIPGLIVLSSILFLNSGALFAAAPPPDSFAAMTDPYATTNSHGFKALAISLIAPSAIGTYGAELTHPVGIQAETWYDLSPAGFGQNVNLDLSANYVSFGVKDTDQAKINFFGLFAGFETHTTRGWLGLVPSIAFQGGLVYDSLSFTTASGTTNSAASFAVQVVPGFYLPVVHRLSILFELPYTAVFTKTTLALWSANFGLRYEL